MNASCSETKITDEKPQAQIIYDNQINSSSSSYYLKEDNFEDYFFGDNKKYQVQISSIKGGEDIGLHYIKNLLSEKESNDLLSLCNVRNGWIASPQRDATGITSKRKERTSSSCPLIWPLFYLSKLQELKNNGKLTKIIENEINLSWNFMQKIAAFTEVDDTHVEPLQLIRYFKGEFYKLHHDHGSYYNLKTEQRPITILLFLSTMPISHERAGYTRFPKPSSKYNQSISIRPVIGDAIYWQNESEDGELLLQALHEAVPPDDTYNSNELEIESMIDGSKGNNGDDVKDSKKLNTNTIVKYAANIWINKDPIARINSAAFKTE